MSLFIWEGLSAGTKTNAQDGRNWKNELGTAYGETRYPGSLTGTYDDVFFDRALATGASSPTTSCDFSAKELLRSVIAGAAFNGAIGATGGYFHCKCSEMALDLAAALTSYIKGEATTGITGLRVIGGKAATILNLDGKITSPSFQKHGGTINILAGATIVTLLDVGYISNPSIDINNLIIISGATLPANVQHRGGSITNYNAIATLLTSSGGIWNQEAGNLAAIEIRGGSLYWNDGNITGDTKVYSGGLFANNSVKFRRMADLYVWQAGIVDLNNGVGNIIITGKITNYGSGSVDLPAGSEIEQYKNWTYAGASDAKYGIAPQSIAASAVINGDAVLLSPQDCLEIFCQVGATDVATDNIAFQVYEDATSAHSTESALTGKVVTFGATDDNKTKKIQVWGYELGTGKYSVRIKATAGSGGASGLIASAYILKKL